MEYAALWRHTTEVRVRPAVISDARSIAEIHVASWKAAYAGQVPAEYLARLSVDQREPIWRQILTSPDAPTSGAVVLVHESTVVGFAHFAPSRDEDAEADVGELTAIYVAPQYWGHGGGRLLIDGTVQRLAEAGFSEATLWVLHTNTRARQFYQVVGWAPDGAEKVDEQRGFSLIEVRYRRVVRQRAGGHS